MCQEVFQHCPYPPQSPFPASTCGGTADGSELRDNWGPIERAEMSMQRFVLGLQFFLRLGEVRVLRDAVGRADQLGALFEPGPFINQVQREPNTPFALGGALFEPGPFIQ